MKCCEEKQQIHIKLNLNELDAQQYYKTKYLFSVKIHARYF